jgi:hypothetical protein
LGITENLDTSSDKVLVAISFYKPKTGNVVADFCVLVVTVISSPNQGQGLAINTTFNNAQPDCLDFSDKNIDARF